MSSVPCPTNVGAESTPDASVRNTAAVPALSTSYGATRNTTGVATARYAHVMDADVTVVGYT